MNLIDIRSRHDRHAILYQLLAERDETINISHKAMPCLGDHARFVEGHPYEAWYFIEAEDAAEPSHSAGLQRPIVGACYLSHQNEIGVAIYKSWRGKGYGPQAIKALIEKHGPRRYLANINPRNEPSARVFSNLGFKIVQHTYELNA